MDFQKTATRSIFRNLPLAIFIVCAIGMLIYDAMCRQEKTFRWLEK